jgi:hypothetical protein
VKYSIIVNEPNAVMRYIVLSFAFFWDSFLLNDALMSNREGSLSRKEKLSSSIRVD